MHRSLAPHDLPKTPSQTFNQTNVTTMEGASSGVSPPPVTSSFINVGSEPISMAYDPANQLLYVLDYGSNSVSVVDTATSAVVAKITVGQSPSSIMFDPFNQMIYVTNFISSDITVIDTRTNGVAYSIDTGNLSSPQSVVYNPANGTIYSLDMGTANLSEINPGTGKILLNVSLGHDEMFDLAFDPINRFLYVTDVANDTVLALDTNSNRIVGYAKVQSFPEAINYDPSTGYLYVSNAGASTVSVLGTSPFETIANVSLPSYAKSLAWNPFNGFEYACSVSGAGSTSNNPPDIFLINSSLAVNLSMNVGGLNASLTDIVFNAAFHSMYVSDGAFDLVWEIALPTAVHRVNFTESNLPPGTSWYANLSNGDLLNSEVANLSLEIPQGTYAYTISTVDKSYMARGGQLQVQNSNQTVLVDFLRVTYRVVFTVSNLPKGSEWALHIPGHFDLLSNNSTITTDLPNGTYAYVVSTGDTAYRNSTGYFNVTGSPVSIPVSMKRVPIPFYSNPLFIVALSILSIVVVAAVAIHLRRRPKF